MTVPTALIVQKSHYPDPSSVSAYANGYIPSSVLLPLPWATPGRLDHLACPEVAKAFLKMSQDFYAAIGRPLSYTGGYRPYAQQESTFRERYFVVACPGTVSWNNQCWRKLPWLATAAVPGTSNHGKGTAIDWCEGTPQKPLDRSPEGIAWMYANAHKYGFAYENPSEDWHIVYVEGDRLPEIFVPFTAQSGEDEMPDYIIRLFGHDEQFACYASGKVRMLGPAEAWALKRHGVAYYNGSAGEGEKGENGETDEAEYQRLLAASKL